MLVGFDIRPLIFTKAGIRTYLYNLILHLARSGGCELRLFVSSKSGIDWKQSSAVITEEVLRFPHLNSVCERFWQEFLLPRAAGRRKIEIFHGTRFFVPAGLRCPSVVTIHDVAFKKFPAFVTPQAGRSFDGLVTSSIKRANAVIVPSQTTKADLIELYGLSEETIRVIPDAASVELKPVTEIARIEAVKEKFSIKGKFILFVGTIEPRKNLSCLLEAYHGAKIKDDYTLVICGGTGWLYQDVFVQAEKLGLKEKVVFTGHVPLDEMACLYTVCEAFVFPSLYEGFGLPVLEAMQFGKAVITSNTSSLAELFKDAGYLIDPRDAHALSRGLERVLLDAGLRKELEAKSTQKARQFSWDTTARETLEVYQLLVKDRR